MEYSQPKGWVILRGLTGEQNTEESEDRITEDRGRIAEKQKNRILQILIFPYSAFCFPSSVICILVFSVVRSLVSIVLNCTLREEPASYQLVGGVKAHQGIDG